MRTLRRLILRFAALLLILRPQIKTIKTNMWFILIALVIYLGANGWVYYNGHVALQGCPMAVRVAFGIVFWVYYNGHVALCSGCWRFPSSVLWPCGDGTSRRSWGIGPTRSAWGGSSPCST